MTIIFDFEDGTTQGWIGEGSTIVSSGAPTGHDGTGSLKIMGVAPIIRVNDANTNTMAMEDGRQIAAWVLVPPGITGTWKAHIEMQDQNFASFAAPDTVLEVGQWTRLTFTPSDAVWSGHKGVAVQFSGENAPPGMVPLYVDSFEQVPTPVVVSPTPPQTVLQAQRAVTLQYIAYDPTTITLIPRTRGTTPSGGYVDVDLPARAAQVVKLILLSSDQRPTITVAGVERLIDYHVMGRWDMAISVGDYWIDSKGTRWDIVGMSDGFGYETKAFASRHVPRNVRP